MVAIFIFIYGAMSLWGFSETVFLYAANAAFVLSLPLGFLLAKHALAFSFSTHALLRKITKNTLHELNIPVATIKGNVYLLRKRAGGDGDVRLDRILKASDRLVELYEELEYAIKKEIKEPQKKSLDLAAFVRKRLELFYAPDPSRFVLDLESFYVNVDEMGLKHCFDNLIGNAIKYSPPHTPIAVSLKDGVLSVADKGCGIEAQDLANIFNRYYQGAGKTCGSGIGLSLVKEFCDSQKVAIGLSSAPGQGTTFRLDFNLTKDDER